MMMEKTITFRSPMSLHAHFDGIAKRRDITPSELGRLLVGYAEMFLQKLTNEQIDELVRDNDATWIMRDIEVMKAAKKEGKRRFNQLDALGVPGVLKRG